MSGNNSKLVPLLSFQDYDYLLLKFFLWVDIMGVPAYAAVSIFDYVSECYLCVCEFLWISFFVCP